MKKTLLGIAFLLGVCLIAWVHQRYKARMAATYEVRCANHMIQFASLLGRYVSQVKPRLPDRTDAGDCLADLLRAVAPDELEPDGKLAVVSSLACPDACARNGTVGYRYVGAGLDASARRFIKTLVLFCPAESHVGRHGHALIGLDINDATNTEMMALLRKAIEEGVSGKVPYTREAIEVMREELAKRMKL